MKELSIFIDESGNFGKLTKNAPYYLISLVFHDQANDISKDIKSLESKLKELGFSEHFYIHVSQIIRNEKNFKILNLDTRRRLVQLLYSFYDSISISHKTFILDKKYTSNSDDMVKKFTYEIKNFIDNNLTELSKYDSIKIYYDKGQTRVTKILHATLIDVFKNVENKPRVSPEKYRLLQIADMVCTFELLTLKRKQGGNSKAEKIFFGDEKRLYKMYLKPFKRKRFGGRL